MLVCASKRGNRTSGMVSANSQSLAAGRPVSRPAVPPLSLIAAATAIGFASLHMMAPALPLLATVFDRGLAEVQLVLTLYFLGIAAGQLFYGPVSDRFGRRPVLLGGLLLFLAGTVLCGLAPSLSLLIAGRVAQALGACAGLVLGRAIIRDVYDREGSARGIALVMMAMSLAPAVSPAIGAYITEWFGWRAMFVLLGGFGTIVIGWAALRLAETLHQPVPLNLGAIGRSYGMLLRAPAFICFALCTAFTSASWFTFIATAPYLDVGDAASAAERLWADDPPADGRLYRRQRRRGAVCPPGRHRRDGGVGGLGVAWPPARRCWCGASGPVSANGPCLCLWR